nr:MAG TPA: hypothetical protein [Caudoviricetes sp.]
MLLSFCSYGKDRECLSVEQLLGEYFHPYTKIAATPKNHR